MRRRCRCRHGLSIAAWVVVLWLAQPGLALMITEVMYHPPGSSAAAEDEALEFIELYNNRAVSEDLSGWAFTNGIDYVFEPNTILGPKPYLVIARDPNALRRRTASATWSAPTPASSTMTASGSTCPTPTAGSCCRSSTATTQSLAGLAGRRRALPGPGPTRRRSGEASSWSASAYLGGTPGEPDPIQASAAAAHRPR